MRKLLGQLVHNSHTFFLRRIITEADATFYHTPANINGVKRFKNWVLVSFRNNDWILHTLWAKSSVTTQIHESIVIYLKGSVVFLKTSYFETCHNFRPKLKRLKIDIITNHKTHLKKLNFWVRGGLITMSFISTWLAARFGIVSIFSTRQVNSVCLLPVRTKLQIFH